MKARLVILGLLVVLVGLIWSKRVQHTVVAAQPVQTEDVIPVDVTDREPATASEDIEAAKSGSTDDSAKDAVIGNTNGFVAETDSQTQLPLAEKIPPADKILDQVKKDPHATPPALVQFSLDLGDKMDAAQNSEPKARALFQELEDCTLGGAQQGRNSIQALCLLNAKRLGNTFPSLARDYEQLERRSDPRTVDMIHGMAL